MRKVVVPPILLIALMLLGAPAGAAEPAADAAVEHAGDRSAINAVLTYRFLAGWNNHDAHIFASAFAEDGRYLIEQFHAQAFQKLFSKSHLSIEVKKIRFLKPDVAVVDVRWEITDSQTADGMAVPYRTGLLDLVFTTSGGPWFITVMHNTDLTPAEAALPADK
jgi:uncharacterized protein (TIGR02246 family)